MLVTNYFWYPLTSIVFFCKMDIQRLDKVNVGNQNFLVTNIVQNILYVPQKGGGENMIDFSLHEPKIINIVLIMSQ